MSHVGAKVVSFGVVCALTHKLGLTMSPAGSLAFEAMAGSMEPDGVTTGSNNHVDCVAIRERSALRSAPHELHCRGRQIVGRTKGGPHHSRNSVASAATSPQPSAVACTCAFDGSTAASSTLGALLDRRRPSCCRGALRRVPVAHHHTTHPARLERGALHAPRSCGCCPHHGLTGPHQRPRPSDSCLTTYVD